MNLQRFKALVDATTSGPIQPTDQTPANDHHFVYAELRRTIGGGPERLKELNAIRRELVIRHAADGDSLAPHYWLICAFVDAIRSEVPTVSEPDWSAAIRCGLENKSKICFAENTALLHDPRSSEVGRAVATLRRSGFDTEIVDASVNVPEEVARRLAIEFDAQAKKIGGLHVLRLAFAEISRALGLDDVTEHLNLVRRVSITGMDLLEAQVPWGFIVQLGLKHAAAPGERGTNPVESFSIFKSLATAAIAIFDVQPYSSFEGMNLDHHHLVQYLGESVLYDSIFTLQQMRGSHAQRIYHGIFTPNQVESLQSDGIRLGTALKIADAILKRTDPRSPKILQASAISSAIGYGIKKTVDWIDRAFAHPIAGPNQSLGYPPRAIHVDSVFLPLVKLQSGHYLVLPRSIAALALLEAVVQLARRADPSLDPKMGTAIEQFLKEEFRRKGIDFKAGPYDLRSSRLNEEKGKASDCDLVIESNSHILFLECKNKVLTRAARSGGSVDILVDLTKSLVHSQIQAMRHEKFLKADSKLELQDPELGALTIEFRDRNVDRISVSLHDYGSLQDQLFLQRYLWICYSGTFGSTDEAAQKRLAELAPKLEELRTLANDLGEFASSQPRPFFAAAFTSVPKLLLLLERSNDNESFVQEWRRTRSIITGRRDFYADYAAMLRLETAAARERQARL